jgi:hypothetical protein
MQRIRENMDEKLWLCPLAFLEKSHVAGRNRLGVLPDEGFLYVAFVGIPLMIRFLWTIAEA